MLKENLRVGMEEKLYHGINWSYNLLEGYQLFEVLSWDKLEDHFWKVNESQVLVILANRKVNEVSWDTWLINVNCRVDKEIFLPVFIWFRMNILVQVHEWKVVQDQAGYFFEEQKSSHRIRIKFCSVIFSVKQLFHQIK